MLESMTMLAQAGKPNPIAYGFVVFCVALVVFLVMLSIYAVVYQAAVKWVTGREPSLGSSAITTFLVGLIVIVQSALFRLALYGEFAAKGDKDPSVVYGCPIIISMIALFIGAREEISFLKSCVVALVYGVSVTIASGVIRMGIVAILRG